MKKLILLIIALLIPVVLNAHTVEIQSVVDDMDSIAPGKAGWDYNHYAEVQVSCNISDPNWSLDVDLSDFSSGAKTFDKTNVRLKVFYIGRSENNNDEDGNGNLWWYDHASYLLSSEFSGYSSADPFVEYDGNTMTICGDSVIPPGNTVQVILGVTVLVPENGVNTIGDYLGSLTFTLN